MAKENVADFPGRAPHLSVYGHPAMDQYVIVPMVGGTYSPVYVGTSEHDVDEVCAAMNSAVHSSGGSNEMFVVECVTDHEGGLNFSLYRDADRMCWVDAKHGDV